MPSDALAANTSAGAGDVPSAAAGVRQEAGDWLRFNDSSVSSMADPKEAVTKQAYMLFFERRGSATAGRQGPSSSAVTASDGAADMATESTEAMGLD